MKNNTLRLIILNNEGKSEKELIYIYCFFVMCLLFGIVLLK